MRFPVGKTEGRGWGKKMKRGFILIALLITLAVIRYMVIVKISKEKEKHEESKEIA